MKPKSIKKEQLLKQWQEMPANQPINPRPVPYKHEGSTYAEDGIRITGSEEFIGSVLSRIKDLIQYENGTTRLAVSYSEQTARSKDASGKPIYHGEGTGSFSCYIKVAERGREAQMVNAIFGGGGIASVR